MKSQSIGLYCLLSVMCVGCGIDKEYDFKSVEMGLGTLEIRHLGAFGFGSHHVRFYWQESNREEFLGQTELANDGAALGDRNLEVVKLGNQQWKIILKGEEQEDEHWLVDTTPGNVRMTKTQKSAEE